MSRLSRLFAVAALLAACSTGASASSSDTSPAPIPAAQAGQAVAVFAGGCFWCMESDFDKMPGVVATTSGYAGGHVANPTYEQVVTETTGHLESVRVVYDTTKTDYAALVDWYLRHVDPTDGGGQFCDRGESYRPAIFPQDASQKATATAALTALSASGWLPGPVKVTVEDDPTFWPAEVYHQDFHVVNPGRYQPYRMGCGRDRRVREVWRNAPAK